jgi:predicted O-methyltransferase YrrM
VEALKMPQKQWTAVDRYITEHLHPADPVLASALAANAAAGLPAIDVAPNQGKLLQLLALAVRARRILEIGTLGGYSTINMARALPVGGRLISLEVNAKHAKVARSNIARSGLGCMVKVHVGPALKSLAKLHAEGVESFDMIFIDADKPNNSAYLQWALKLSHLGTLIVCDNVVRDGELVDARSKDPAVIGSRMLFETLAAEPRVSATALQTVGSKGHDGLALAVVIAE